MKRIIIIISLIFSFELLKSQEIDNLLLRPAVLKGDTIIYKRIFEYHKSNNLFHVKDYFENGQLQGKVRYWTSDGKLQY